MATEAAKAKIIKTTLTLLGEKSWDEVSLHDIAESASITLPKLREAFSSKLDIIEGFAKQTDIAVLEALDQDMDDEHPRERLMDILLSRLDEITDYKPAISNLMKAAKQDPCLAANLNKIACRSQSWMLTGTNINTDGAMGAIRIQGTVLVFTKAIKVWLNDEDPDMAKTMTTLDKELRKGERTMKRIGKVAETLNPFAKTARKIFCKVAA